MHDFGYTVPIMTILVFGGTGLIGTGTVAQLCTDGEIVSVAARRQPDEGELLDLSGQYAFHEGDITDPEFVSTVVNETKPTGIIHLAAMLIGGCEKDPAAAHEVNVNGTMHILRAAAKANVKRFIFASTIAVYGGGDGPFEESMDPSTRSVYGASKFYSEISGRRFAKQHDISYTALRYSGVIGPATVKGEGMAATRDKIKSTVSGNDVEISTVSGDERTQYTYISEAVDATLAALRHPNPKHPVYNVAGPDENCVSFKEYHALIKRLVPSAGNVRFTGRAMRGGGRMTTKRMREDLNVTPTITVEQGLREELSKKGLL